MANAKKKTGRTTPAKLKVVIPTESTPAQNWKKSGGTTHLAVPSGHVALVSNPGLQSFLAQGVIPNSLMPIVQKALQGEKPQQNEVAELIMDPTGIAEMLDFTDRIVLACVVEPALTPAPPKGSERDSSVLYVDEVDLEDKLFIFQWVMGGTRDLEPFREAIAEGLESVPSSPDVVD